MELFIKSAYPVQFMHTEVDRIIKRLGIRARSSSESRPLNNRVYVMDRDEPFTWSSGPLEFQVWYFIQLEMFKFKVESN